MARLNSSPSSRERSHQLVKWVLAVAFAALGAGIAYGWTNHAHEDGDGAPSGKRQGADGDASEGQKLKVKVVHPRKGGITRTTTQPGVLHAFQYADLYAKASGFLIAQAVDIGDTVERGQELAEIFDPERQQQVEQAAAAVQQGRAEVEQALAGVKTAEAMVESAKAFVEEKQAQVATYAAARKYHRKEYLRYIELTQQKAIDQRVSDEKEKQYESALAAEQEADAAVKTAQADLTKAQAEVTTAQANVTAARAKVQVLEAEETQAEILVQYLKLTSPYDGVVTNRNYHRGDFIRSADQGSQPPVLSVARTDRIRVVVYIPDRDVPFLDRGDEAVVRVDALSGEEFRGKVSRYSAYEDPANRTMRAEIDLENPTGRLREGMYGGVTILLEPPSENLLLPSSALHKESESGEGEVFVVQGGHARRRKVKLGRDNGIVVEVTGGLTVKDLVVISYSGSLEDDEPVEAGPVDETSK